MRTRLNISILILIGISISLSSCQRNSVALQSTNAKGEVPQLGNLTFKFDKSVYPDSLLNAWDSTEYISFSPKIPGKFRWKGPDELVFSPSEPLLPSTDYTAEINDAVFKHSKYNSVKVDNDISFHTALLQLTDAQSVWVLKDQDSRTSVPELHLNFNYPVDPKEVEERLKLTVEGIPSAYTMQTEGAGTTCIIRLNNFKTEDKNYEAKLTIDKGLTPIKGKISTTEQFQATVSIPSPLVLFVNNVEAEHDGSEGTVRIYTSQTVTGDVSKLIKFDPAIPFTIEYAENVLLLKSEKFEADKSYTFTIAEGMHGTIGGMLKETYYGSVAFGQLESDIKFSNTKAVYLSKNGAGNIEVRITNTPKIKLVISKIYENNLLMAMKMGYTPDDRNENQEYVSEDYYEDGNSMAGDIVFTKEIDTRSLPKSGAGRILNVSQFEDKLPDFKGIYHLMIRSSEDYWIRDSRFISLSDIGLIAKRSAQKVLVFANSIKTAKPAAGVTINIYGSNNQLLGTAATNEDGAAEIPINTRNMQGFRPAMVIAKTVSDFTYLPFNNTEVNTSRFDVGGKRLNISALDAFIYAERDIYRPGEKINFAVVIRDNLWKTPGEIPVKLVMLLPNGKEFKSFRKSLNEQGAAEGSVDISTAAITGSYTLELFSSNDVLLSTKNFMVEEFVPDRIKVDTKLDKSSLGTGESASLKLTAVNFFGPPAANRNYEIEIQVKQQQFSAPKYSDYNFYLANQESFFDKDVRQGKTDINGSANEIYTVPSIYSNVGLLQTSFFTTVFDETGRPVSRHTTADIYTQNIFNGIRDDGSYYYSLNQPVKFDMVSVGKNGLPVNSTARVQVIKNEYRTVLTKSASNYFRYESQKEVKILSDQNMAIGANTPFSFTPRSPGDYEIRVYRPGANTFVRKTFYSYGPWGNENASFEVSTEGNIEIETDKEKYAGSEKAKLLFKTPFSGRMLVTLESDHVLSYQYVDVIKRSASLEIELNNDYLPNIYVTATLIKPHEVSDMPLTVAHGFKNITVEDKSRNISVDIQAAASVRSGTHQKVQVKTIPGSYITLAAVDNGVLQVTDFKTPDPYGYFYQRKALQVYANDMYPLLFPELHKSLSSTGGDGEVSNDKMVNPMQAKRIKIMSYWSGIKKSNNSGIADFEFDIPQYNGQIRLMAVAYKDEKFGAAEKNTTVADPIVLSSALPRFITPGDTVLVPVTITNTTSKTAGGQANISVSSPLKVFGASSANINIPANSESRVQFSIIADPRISIAKVNVSVNALSEKFKEETEISIRPPSTLQKISGSGSIAGGSSEKITIPKENFIPSSYKYDLVISRSPVIELADQLRYLVQYPYGCTEQVVSSAFPQLYYGDLTEMIGLKNKQAANENIQEAIRKIKMRQLFNGGLTLWDGEGTEHWWATIYAAHFLIEAQKAGFDVDDGLLQTMLSFISNKLKTKETIIYYYNRDKNRKIAPKEVPYSLYVLALAGRSQVSAMNYYKSNPQLLALDGKYLLSAAFALSGDKRSYASLLPGSFSGEESVQESGGSFYSFLRDEAISLNSLLDVDPGNPQIPFMAKHVGNMLKAEHYPNTQERSFSFLALGKIAHAAAKSTATAELKSNGKTLAVINDNWKGNSNGLKENNFVLETKGNGRLYYTWIAEGISTNGDYKEEDNYIKVRRRFFDRSGRQILGNTFKQNDLVIVQLSIERIFNSEIQNIVITDLLPAGFEIENPRTKEVPGTDWIKDADEPTAIDIRDDRINLFVDANNSKAKYYYVVRAVSTGTFKQGPVTADAMYNGEIHSYNGAQTIKVIGAK